MPKYSLLNQDINTSFLNIETTWAGMRSPLLKKQIGQSVPDSFCELIKGETLNYFQNSRQAVTFSHLCAQKILQDKALLASIKRKTISLAKQSLKLAEANFPLPKLADSKIIKLLIKMRRLQMDLAAWGMVVAFADVRGEISEQIMKVFSGRKGLKHPLNLYLETLANPANPSLTAAAYKKIALSRNDSNLKRKYFWLDQGYIGRGLDQKQLSSIRRHYRLEKIIKDSERIKLAQELKLSAAEKKLLTVSGEMVSLKYLRSDSRQALYVITNNIIDLLAVRWHIPARYLEALSTKELVAAIHKPKSLADNLSNRWTHSVFIPKSTDDYQILCDARVEKFLRNRVNQNQEQVQAIKELAGQVAQAGKVRGRIKLVFGPQHNSKIKKGDILVSVSTSPQLLPAMKLAAAFVTDMGGITSHAAIVAREFRKPCIVGTKIATQVLHDGDLVEVDATKGIVKIIKNK